MAYSYFTFEFWGQVKSGTDCHIPIIRMLINKFLPDIVPFEKKNCAE